MHTIFHVLSRFGKGELAFKMITKKEYPSYGCLIENGDTSFVERFMPNGSPEDSHNHHYMGDIARWFIREIAGLRVENFKTVVIEPDFSLPISSAEAYYELPAGRISVKWETENDGKIRIEYACPSSVDCTLKLPQNVEISRL